MLIITPTHSHIHFAHFLPPFLSLTLHHHHSLCSLSPLITILLSLSLSLLSSPFSSLLLPPPTRRPPPMPSVWGGCGPTPRR